MQLTKYSLKFSFISSASVWATAKQPKVQRKFADKFMSTNECLNLCWQAADHEEVAGKKEKWKHMQRELIALEIHKKAISLPFS